MNINEQHVKQEAQKKEFCELLRSTQREGVTMSLKTLRVWAFLMRQPPRDFTSIMMAGYANTLSMSAKSV